ncbi:hypothetical protein PMAYCL1PPCAC_27552, partial [Pristionchus mayeri]
RTAWHKYPHMAAIMNNGRVSPPIFSCSGAFISQVHVITVAHCLFELNEEKKIDDFLSVVYLQSLGYKINEFVEVRYGSECYEDEQVGNLNKCEDQEMAKTIKTSKVRSVIIEGIKSTSDYWRFSEKVVLLELEQAAPRDVVIPICLFPGELTRQHKITNLRFNANAEDSFILTAAGNPNAENLFVSAKGNELRNTNCDEFRANDRIRDFNCRDDNVDLKTLGKNNPASGFTASSAAFLGSQISIFNATLKKRSLYGLAHYFSGKIEENVLGAFFPIAKNERFICWFTGVCINGRPYEGDNRKFMIYTPEYRLTRAMIDAPVQRAGKNNVSNYEIVMVEEFDTQW